MTDSSKTRIGLFGISLDTYWGQFDGLLDKLTGYQNVISSKLQEFHVDVVNAGIADTQ